MFILKIYWGWIVNNSKKTYIKLALPNIAADAKTVCDYINKNYINEYKSKIIEYKSFKCDNITYCGVFWRFVIEIGKAWQK